MTEHDEFCLDLEYGWHDERGDFHPPAGGGAHEQYHRRVVQPVIPAKNEATR